jgi:hypothetical protein
LSLVEEPAKYRAWYRLVQIGIVEDYAGCVSAEFQRYPFNE